MKFDIPILFLIFNRPHTTKEVFNEIARVKPSRLYLASDGPRSERPYEAEIVKSIRDYVIENINWECEVLTRFNDQNLGCKVAVSSAIDWFFSNEEEGIILEDDCLPSPTFFRFCEENLKKYKADKRVWHISGGNFNEGWLRNPQESYYFGGIYGSIWGWATWADRWHHYDVKMESYGQYLKGQITEKDIYDGSEAVADRLKIIKKSFYGYDTWDFQWVWARWINSGLTINPARNLVKNIGFGEDATHTKLIDRKALLNADDMTFPLKHPKFVIRDAKTEKYFHKHFVKENLIKKLVRYLLRKINA